MRSLYQSTILLIFVGPGFSIDVFDITINKITKPAKLKLNFLEILKTVDVKTVIRFLILHFRL